MSASMLDQDPRYNIYSSTLISPIWAESKDNPFQVKVDMTKAVNVQLHISLNGMKDSEVEVKMDGTYNTSVHVSFQNPVNTPVKAGRIISY